MNIYLFMNWKMNNTSSQAFSLLEKYTGLLESTSTSLVFSVFPPFPYLFPMFDAASQGFVGGKIKFGAQNVFHEPFGAYTGEVSPPMLAGVCEYALVGHSERRLNNNESNASINKKIHLIINNYITPVLCIGEGLEAYNSGQVDAFLEDQIKAACDGLKNMPVNKFIIAYEPAWAIGSGLTPPPEIINRRAFLIKSVVSKLGLMAGNSDCPVLYGGSVNSINAKSFLELDYLDGLLIGQASLDVTQISPIIDQAASLINNSE